MWNVLVEALENAGFIMNYEWANLKKCTKSPICPQMKIYVFLDFYHLKSFKIGEKLCNILDLLIYSYEEKPMDERAVVKNDWSL